MTALFIGSHLSTSGGWNALLKRSHDEGGTTFAFFPRSPYGSRSKSLTVEGATNFAHQLVTEHYGPLVAHAPYVYNLAAKDQEKQAFAITALAEDLRLLASIKAAGQAIYLNIHPGAHVGQGAEKGCQLISDGLNRVFDVLAADDTNNDTHVHVPILLETMAGKGTECGRSFEELATIINNVDPSVAPLIGVTVDTCHVFDAGYDVLDHFDDVKHLLNDVIGMDRVRAIHVNDSQFGFESHKDRHANIGDGKLGLTFFEQLVNDPQLSLLPMILETKELTPTTHRDEIVTLRGLRH